VTQLTNLMQRLERFPLSLLQLAMRIGGGAVFFRSGLLKLDSWEFTIQLFRDEYKVPLLDPTLAAQAATIVELGVPPLLFAGLATRFATLPLLGMIAVIQVFVYPNAWSDHLMWAAALLFICPRPGRRFARSRDRKQANDAKSSPRLDVARRTRLIGGLTPTPPSDRERPIETAPAAHAFSARCSLEPRSPHGELPIERSRRARERDRYLFR
jgi:putative oxidoreductase